MRSVVLCLQQTVIFFSCRDIPLKLQSSQEAFLSLSISLFSKIDFGAINGFQFVAAFKWRKISEIKKPWSASVEGSVVPLPIQLSKSSSIEVFGWGEVAGKESWLQDTFIHSKQYQHQLPISLNRFTKWFSAF